MALLAADLVRAKIAVQDAALMYRKGKAGVELKQHEFRAQLPQDAGLDCGSPAQIGGRVKILVRSRGGESG